MDQSAFEARLRVQNYPEIRTNQLAPNCRNAEHTHAFDVKALVLEGEITLTIAGAARTPRTSVPKACAIS